MRKNAAEHKEYRKLMRRVAAENIARARKIEKNKQKAEEKK